MASDDVLRKNRGLGMLLASIGGNKDSGAPSKGLNTPALKAAPSGNQGFNPESSGFSSWDDIPFVGGAANDSKMTAEESNSGQAYNGAERGNRSEEKKSRQGKSGNTSARAQKDGRKGTKEFQDEDVYGPREMSGWADIKEYDDDHDSEWFEEENARLAKKYGGNFIFAKYLDTQPGRIGYLCQICSAEMNAKKSLELHCGGMKHLKRKDQWEKGEKGEKDEEHGENSGGRPERGPRHPIRRPMKDPSRHTWSDRGHPRRDSVGGHRPHGPPRPYRGPPSPEYRRDDYSRYSDSLQDNYYRKEPMPYRPPYDRDPYDGRRNSPDAKHGYDHQPGPARRDAGDRYPRDTGDRFPRDAGDRFPRDAGDRFPRDAGDRFPRDAGDRFPRDAGDRYSRERFNPYGRREAPPPPVISGSPSRDAGVAPKLSGRNDVNMSASLFEGISDGSCGELLKKLSVCRVKNKEDTALATNVASFLAMSLKEFYSKIGPPTIIHILDEIVLKMSIIKDLQK